MKHETVLDDIAITAAMIEGGCGIASGEFPDVAFMAGARWAEQAILTKLAEKAQAVAFSEHDFCDMQYAVGSLRAIADRQEQVLDEIWPLNNIRDASNRAKAALTRLCRVEAKMLSAIHGESAKPPAPSALLEAAEAISRSAELGQSVINGFLLIDLNAAIEAHKKGQV